MLDVSNNVEEENEKRMPTRTGSSVPLGFNGARWIIDNNTRLIKVCSRTTREWRAIIATLILGNNVHDHSH